MKILVTGANGLLGHHVVKRLLELQHEVSIIVRSTNNIHFELSKIALYKGSFTDIESLKRAASGCNAIIHIAAVTDTNLLHYSDYADVNVTACEQLIRVSEELAIHNIVFVSSANTIGYGNAQMPADEQREIQFPFTDSLYAQSKLAAEQLFRTASTLSHKHIVIVNPCFIVGAMDPKPSSGKLLIMGYKKRLMFVPKGGKNFVPAVDVATLICNALGAGNNGERYLAAGKNMSFRAFYTLQKQIGGYKQTIIEIPNIVLKIAGKLGDLIRLVGIKTDVCSINLRQLIIQEHYDNQKAKTDLHLPESDLKLAIKEALNWFKSQKMIDA